MTFLEELKDTDWISWVPKVASSKKNALDKQLFLELIGVVERKDSVQAAMDHCAALHTKMCRSSMVGPRLLAGNAKTIYDKLWSLTKHIKT